MWEAKPPPPPTHTHTQTQETSDIIFKAPSPLKQSAFSRSPPPPPCQTRKISEHPPLISSTSPLAINNDRSLRWRSRMMYRGLSEKGLKPEISHVLFSISKLVCYTEQKSLFKTSTCWNFTVLWYIYFPDTSKEAMCHTRFNFCYWWRNWITLNCLLFANFHFSKTARNVSDSKKCDLYLIDKI